MSSFQLMHVYEQTNVAVLRDLLMILFLVALLQFNVVSYLMKNDFLRPGHLERVMQCINRIMSVSCVRWHD